MITYYDFLQSLLTVNVKATTSKINIFIISIKSRAKLKLNHFLFLNLALLTSHKTIAQKKAGSCNFKTHKTTKYFYETVRSPLNVDHKAFSKPTELSHVQSKRLKICRDHIKSDVNFYYALSFENWKLIKFSWNSFSKNVSCSMKF